MPGLDSLRGLAVTVVVGYHLGYLSGGFLGVDVFFVLSGYLVTSLLLNELQAPGWIDLRRFWAGRIRRLLPAVLVLVPTVIAAAVVLDWPRTRLDALVLDAGSTLTWWANWRQASGVSYWAEGTPNLFRHAWSLSIEEQFYLLWPILVLGSAALAKRAGRSPRAVVGVVAGTLALASAVWSVVLTRRVGTGELSRVYVGTDTRAMAPLVGCFLAAAVTGRRSGPLTRAVGAAAGAVGAVVLTIMVVRVSVDDPALYRRGGFLVAAVAAGALLLVATRLERVDPVSRYLGLRSYAIYLWSWPVQVLAQRRWPDAPRTVLSVLIVVATVALAEVSHHLVEHPIRRSASWARRADLRRVAWSVGLATPVVALVAASALAVAPPIHEQLDAEAALAIAREQAEAAEGAGPTTPPPPGAERVLVVGDSIAFTAVFNSPPDPPEGIDAIIGAGVIGCGMLAGEGYEWRQRADGEFAEANPTCREGLLVEAEHLAREPDVVLQMFGAWEVDDIRSPDGEVIRSQTDRMTELLGGAIVDRARAAGSVGARTVLTPWVCPGPEAYTAGRTTEYITWFNDTLALAAAAGREEGLDVQVLDVPPAVCTGGDPTAQPTDAKDEAMAGEVHVDGPEGGRWLWYEWLAPAIVASRSS